MYRIVPLLIRSPSPRLADGDRIRRGTIRYIRVIRTQDRKSTRLNSSHVAISYAVFCLKKKKKTKMNYNLKIKSSNSNKRAYTNETSLRYTYSKRSTGTSRGELVTRGAFLHRSMTSYTQ